MDKLTMAKGRQVTIQDQELVRRREENKKYLLELDNENLLLPYTLEAGLYKTSELPSGIHGGWESPLCELRGHFLGHWLSAAAMHFEATGDRMVKAKADEIVDILEKCQRENGGRWAASIPEKQYIRLLWDFLICMSWPEMKKPWRLPYILVNGSMTGADAIQRSSSKES